MEIVEFLKKFPHLFHDSFRFYVDPRSIIQLGRLSNGLSGFELFSTLTAVIVVLNLIVMGVTKQPIVSISNIDWTQMPVLINGVQVDDVKPQVRHLQLFREVGIGVDSGNYVVMPVTSDGSAPCAIVATTAYYLRIGETPISGNAKKVVRLTADYLRTQKMDQLQADVLQQLSIGATVNIDEDAIPIFDLSLRQWLNNICNGSFIYAYFLDNVRLIGYSPDRAKALHPPLLDYPYAINGERIALDYFRLLFGAFSIEFSQVSASKLPTSIVVAIVWLYIVAAGIGLKPIPLPLNDSGGIIGTKGRIYLATLACIFPLVLISLFKILDKFANISNNNATLLSYCVTLLMVAGFLRGIYILARPQVGNWKQLVKSMLLGGLIAQLVCIALAAPLATLLILYYELFEKLI